MGVSFTTQPKVHEYQRVGNDLRSNVWWNAKEYRQFRGYCAAVLAAVERDASLAPSYCLRGLEHFRGDNYQERRKRIKESVMVVLNEQASLKKQGIRSCTRRGIAEKYQQVCARQRLEAHLKGLKDEETQLLQYTGASENRLLTNTCQQQSSSPPTTLQCSQKRTADEGFLPLSKRRKNQLIQECSYYYNRMTVFPRTPCPTILYV